MPQVSKVRRQPLRDRTIPIKDKGDVCYLITAMLILPMWMQNPCWSTASEIRRMLVCDPDMAKLKSLLRGCPFDDMEIRNQAALAFMEFYRRVVANYEDAKAKLNTDVFYNVTYARSGILTKGE